MWMAIKKSLSIYVNGLITFPKNKLLGIMKSALGKKIKFQVQSYSLYVNHNKLISIEISPKTVNGSYFNDRESCYYFIGTTILYFSTICVYGFLKWLKVEWLSFALSLWLNYSGNHCNVIWFKAMIQFIIF